MGVAISDAKPSQANVFSYTEGIMRHLRSTENTPFTLTTKYILILNASLYQVLSCVLLQEERTLCRQC